jgi:hypothetical protein
LRPQGRPWQTSGMTTQANSQLLRPDFHRQDTRPHGLRAKIAKAAKVRQLCRIHNHNQIKRF